MKELLQNALYGPGSYFQSNHTAVLAGGVLLYFFVSGAKVSAREKRLLGLTAVMLVLVLFPVSAAALMLYQTGFYSYPWIWSLVPVTLCIAWGSVKLLWELTAQKRRDGKEGLRLAAGVAVLLALLVLTGNLGNLRGVSEEEKSRQSAARQVADYMEEILQAKETMLWAPRTVLEAVRMQSGEIRVLYGRDMWEPAAAAYAYDTYSMERQRLFDWMEALGNGNTGEIPVGLAVFLEETFYDRIREPGTGWEKRQDQELWSLLDAYMLRLAAQSGSRIWVFPQGAEERITRACGRLQEEYGLQAQAVGEVADYMIWCCE